jgi:TrmH family RNA methyltransferase
MTEPYIHSRQNDQIKNLVKLRERKHRDRQQRFLIEGLREIGHALQATYDVQDLYYCPEFFPSDAHATCISNLRKKDNLRLTRLSEEAYSKASLREGPDGLLAVAQQRANALAQLKLPKNPLLLVVEGIEKPGNLGAILRSADGAGVDAVILVDCVLDLYNPNAIRSSQGLIFALPIASASREALTDWLGKNAIQVVATTPQTEDLHWNIDYRPATALFLGSESNGLSEYWLEQATARIRIPMAGRADSLNVAAATAVCLYEAARQRALSENPLA